MNNPREFRMQTLIRLIEIDNNDLFSRYALALEYVSSLDKQNALFHFLFLLNNHPEYIPTYYQLAKLYEQLNDTDAAIATYQKGIAIAQKAKDLHALSELRSALQELEMEL
jgi:tetratricopeptide (TPR) repeat protein